jgi:flagellar hook-associated protein 3 FlgL
MIQRIGTGDMALTTLLSRQSSTLRAELNTRMAEISTGRHGDMGAAVGGDFSALAAIDHSLARLAGYKANTTEAGLFTDAMQSTLEVVSSSATELATTAVRSVALEATSGLGALTLEADRIFSTTVAALNTRFSERALFSGVNADVSPLPDAETILTALQAATATAVTVSDVMTAIDDWFMGATGYQAAYAGGAPRADVPIAPGETASLDVTALDPALRETLRDMAGIALLGRGLLAGQTAARAQLAKQAGEGLMTSGEARAQLMARVGTTQAQISAATTRNGAEQSALEIAQAGIVSADPYDAATRLEDLQTRIEALYLITARVSRLSLADYI